MIQQLEKFERIVTYTLIIMMSIVVLLSTIELVLLIVKDIMNEPLFILELGELLELFGQFLLVLIGIELVHTMKIYLVEKTIHLEAMLVVALIAIARKIITLEPQDLPDGTLLGIGALVFSLTLGYYLVRRSRWEKPYQN